MKVVCIWFDQPTQTNAVAELFLRFSPQISVINERAIFVEIGKCSKLYSEASFLARSQILLKKMHCSGRLRFGQNITDSLVLAKFNVMKIDALPLITLVDFADPFCRDAVLRKSVLKLIQSFTDLGIKSLGQFKCLPLGELISRFGIVGRLVYQRVHLQDFVSWPQWEPAEVIQEFKQFPYFEFYGELDPILFELKSQLDRIFARLFSRKKRAMKLQVKVICEKLTVHPNHVRVFDFAFFAPQSSVKSTLKIIRERLNREFEKKPILSPIEAIETTILKSVNYSDGQKNFFNQDEEKQELISSVHNQLIEILGQQNVFEVELTEDRRPEKSWRKKFDRPHEKSENNDQAIKEMPERLTYICRQPIKIEVTAGYIHIQKKRYKIVYWDNDIERINGAWFEKPNSDIKDNFDRNYSLVEIEKCQKLAVFQTPDRHFYLHGYSA
jgi:hypothetical protein